MTGIPEIKDTELILKGLLDSDKEGLVRKAAENIRSLIESTFELQNALSSNTCVKCSEPCCSVATIWYDIKDLIFLVASGITPPGAQPRKNSDRCIYFNPEKGCTIERIRRPFICNYYICGVQRGHLRKCDRYMYEKLNTILDEAKNLRKYMEEEFLKMKKDNG